MTKTIALKQPAGEQSCVAYVAAMATGTSPQEFMVFCKTLAIAPCDKPPYDDIHFYAYLLSKGFMCGLVLTSDVGLRFNEARDGHEFHVDSLNAHDSPAYAIVEGPIDPTMDHAIYWDGEQVFDPAPGIRNGRPLSAYKIKQWAPICKIHEVAE